MTFREIYIDKFRKYEEEVSRKPHLRFLKEVSEKAGVSPSYVRQLVYNEDLVPSMKTAVRISLALGQPVGELFPPLAGKEGGHVS